MKRIDFAAVFYSKPFCGGVSLQLGWITTPSKNLVYGLV